MPLFSRMPFNKKEIEAAISRLESYSSAELRVYIERKKPKEINVLDRALNVFDELGMHNTQKRNGVLIYISFCDHQCSILGDQGIHQYVGDSFWQSNYELMADYFKQKQYTQGVIAAIEKIGQELASHFPIQPDDQNELENEVIIHG